MKQKISKKCILNLCTSLIMIATFLLFSFRVVFATEESTQKELQILFTHDLHSHLNEYKTFKNGETQMIGGFARIKTIIDDVKQQNPNTFVLDAGDFSMGTLYQTIYLEEASELRLLGSLGYDATTLGNHELDYEGTGFAKMLLAAKASNDHLPAFTIANLDFSNPDSKQQTVSDALLEYGARDYFIIEKGDTRMAVFGIIGYDAIDYSPTSGLKFKDPIETAKNVVKKIKENENVDLIVCLSHSGTSSDPAESEDEILAKEVPGIDVILSGHTHTKLEEPIMVGSTLIASCGSYGEFVGNLELSISSEGDISMKNYELIPVTADVKEDKAILEEVKYYTSLVEKKFLSNYGFSFNQVLAYNPFTFTSINDLGDELEEEPLGNLISDSYVYSIKQAEGDSYEPVDVAIVANGVIRETFLPGDITISDVYTVSSLGIGSDGIPGYPLVSVYLTGKELKAVAELDASVSPMMNVAQLYMSGMRYTLNPNRLIFNKVTDVSLIREDGSTEKLEDDKLYRVVSGMYSAQMLGTVKGKSFGILSIVPKDKDGNPITDYNKHIIYSENGELKEWIALANYLQSFTEDDSISIIPDQYSSEEGRKTVVHSRNIIELVKNPNGIFFIVLAIVILLIALIIWIGFMIRKLIIKRKVKKIRKRKLPGKRSIWKRISSRKQK